MSISQGERRCDQCGRRINNAHRVYNHEDYCHTCYKREFPVTVCSRCGGSARLHVSQKSTECSSCRRAQRNCGRCGKPTPKAGLVKDGVAYCPACANTIQGRRTTNTADYITCSSCGRHRPMGAEDARGRSVCKNCLTEAGAAEERAKVDEYWVRRHFKDTMELAAQLPNQQLEHAFAEFSYALADSRGHRVAALALKQHYAELKEIEQLLDGLFTATSEDFRRIIDAKLLRKYERWWTFLANDGLPVPTREQAQERSEQRRTTQILEELNDADCRQLATSYLQSLLRTEKSVQTKTARVYARAAVSLLTAVGTRPTQKALDHWVCQNPGHRASIARFVSYLNNEQGLSLSTPAAKKKRPPSKEPVSTSGESLDALISKTTNAPMLRALLIAKFVHIWGLNVQDACKLPASSARLSGRKAYVRIDDEWVELTGPLRFAFARHIAQSKITVGDHVDGPLFPGRPATDPVSVDTVRYHLRKHNVEISSSKADARQWLRGQFG